MSTILTNGLKLPDKGSVDWYSDMQNNYTILDGAVGTIAEHTTALAGKAPAVHTHTKSDVTDLFNSANTWSGEQTFSQTIQGNAATASAFDTAKPITLTGAVTGTVSGTNSWEIATVLKTGTASTRGTVPNPYFKIASWEVAPNKYFGAILQIQNKCYPHSVATLILSVRTKTDATFQAGYSILNNAIGVLPSDFILCYKEVTGKVLCELYYYTTIAYNGIRFSVISEGVGIQEENSLFNTMVVYRDPTGIATLPSDYTAIQTTIGTYTQDFIPYSANTYNLGSSSYQWNNVYCNSVYSPAIINSQNAASPSDSSVSSIVALRSIVTYTSGDPAAVARLNFRLMGTGEKSLYPHESNQYSFGLASRAWQNSYIQHGYFIGQQQNDEYSTNARTNLTLTANRDSVGVSGILVDSFRSNTSQGQAHHILGFEMKENSVRYSGCRMHWAYDSNVNKYNFALCPTKQGNNQPASFGLGVAGYLWDTFNGINPGALSLPNLASDGYMDLSDHISVNTEYSYTPTVDGWLALYVQTTGFHAENAVGIFTGGGSSNSYRWACSVTSAINLPRANTYHGAVMLPVKAGIPYLCWITIDSSTTLSSKRLYFYKATGNV